MPLNQIQLKDTTDTTSSPSPNLWGNCSVLEYLVNRAAAVVADDFIGGPLVAANAAEGQYGNWRAYTGATAGSYIINGSTTAVGGQITLESTTDNEGAAIRSLPAFKIALGQGKLWFEARYKAVNITDSKFNAFIGLAEDTALSNAFPLTTSDAMADANFVGFQRVFADGDALDTTYKANGVTAVTVGADAITTVADTFVKLGMYFDGTNLYFYKDGARLADYKTIPSAAGTDFPNDVALGVIAAIMLGHGDTGSITLDWVYCVQEKVA